MMTHDAVRERRRAGAAFLAGLLALWLSAFPWGGFALLLRLASFVGFVLATRGAIDPDYPTRRKVAALVLVVAAVVQLQNFAHRLTLGADSEYSDYVRFFLADNAVPALVLLSAALLPRLSRRRSEIALLWVAAGLAIIFILVGTANGTMMQTTGDPSPAAYQVLVLALRALAFAPAVAAGVMLLVPARQVVTEEEAWEYAREQQARAADALRQAADGLAALNHPLASDQAPTSSPPTFVTPPTAASPPSGDHEILTLLEGRLARGELSEQLYRELRAKYQR